MKSPPAFHFIVIDVSKTKFDNATQQQCRSSRILSLLSSGTGVCPKKTGIFCALKQTLDSAEQERECSA
jgi:hypothetical protein